MKLSLFFLIIFYSLIFISCADKPNQSDLLEVIELKDKNYNIEIYIDRSGDATTSNTQLAYLHYHDGEFERIYSVYTNEQGFDIKRVNKDSIAIFVITRLWPEGGRRADTIYDELP